MLYSIISLVFSDVCCIMLTVLLYVLIFCIILSLLCDVTCLPFFCLCFCFLWFFLLLGFFSVVAQLPPHLLLDSPPRLSSYVCCGFCFMSCISVFLLLSRYYRGGLYVVCRFFFCGYRLSLRLLTLSRSTLLPVMSIFRSIVMAVAGLLRDFVCCLLLAAASCRRTAG